MFLPHYTEMWLLQFHFEPVSLYLKCPSFFYPVLGLSFPTYEIQRSDQNSRIFPSLVMESYFHPRSVEEERGREKRREGLGSKRPELGESQEQSRGSRNLVF